MVSVKGGDKLGAALAAYQTKASATKGVDVGFQNGATEADGTSVALVAALNEYGTSRAPPRPFFRQAIASNEEKWRRQFVTGFVNTGGDGDKVFGLMGEQMAGDIRASIIALTSPPLAESTIQRKGFDKPLIDTSTMLNNVTWVTTK